MGKPPPHNREQFYETPQWQLFLAEAFSETILKLLHKMKNCPMRIENSSEIPVQISFSVNHFSMQMS